MEQARQHGVNVVVQALRLDSNVLKRRVRSVEQRQKRAAMPAFVELIGAAGAVEERDGAGLGGAAAGVARNDGMIQITLSSSTENSF